MHKDALCIYSTLDLLGIGNTIELNNGRKPNIQMISNNSMAF